MTHRKATLVAIIMCVMLLVGCSRANFFNSLQTEAEQINQNSHLGMEFYSALSLPENEAKQYNDDNPKLNAAEDGGVTGYYFRYPSPTDCLRLTEISINSSKYDIYGIKVGDEISSVGDIMTGKGYESIGHLYYDETKTNTKSYLKNGIYVIFEVEEDSTQIVKIDLYVTKKPVY